MPYPILALLLCGTVSLCAQMPFDSLRFETSDTLYFDFGEAQVRSRGDSILRQMAANWTAGKQIYLTAHTDSVGSMRANERLAQARAEAAKSRLGELGVADSVLVIETFGERQPISRDTTEAARQRNRRVTIDLYRPQQYRRTVGKIQGKDGKGLDATILFKGKWFEDSLKTTPSGKFEIDLPVGEVIGMEVYAPGYLFSNKLFKVTAQQPLELDQSLAPADVGTIADIEDLFFIGGRADLLPKSKPTLPRVLRFMEVNKDLRVEIAGHVNYPNSPPMPKGTFEYDLSERRARLVYDYLIENGVSTDRLQYKAYSNFEMRFPQARNEREQAENRRVEIRILGENTSKD